MLKQDPRWRIFWQNFFWFIATLVVLIILIRYYPLPAVLLILWGVGLVWGGWLAYQLSKLLFDRNLAATSQVRSAEALSQARDYQKKILKAIEQMPERNSVRSVELVARINRLTEAIAELTDRVSDLRSDETIQRDTQTVPAAIENLQQRLDTEDEPTIKQQLHRTLSIRQKQLESLDALENTIKRAEIQIESTLSQMGTIYSHILTGQSASDVADYNRITANVDEEVRLLEDRLAALREVKLGDDQLYL
jgi:hypothetical protein